MAQPTQAPKVKKQAWTCATCGIGLEIFLIFLVTLYFT
jgi:hypothetical protein